MTSELSKRIKKSGHIRGFEINKRSYALLTIKPPGVSAIPLEISDRQTQLADIPATVYDLFDWNYSGGKEGLSVFAEDFPDTREIHIFYTNRDYYDEFNHLSHRAREEWKIHPDILPSSKIKKSKSKKSKSKKSKSKKSKPTALSK